LCRNEAKIHENSAPELKKKQCLKTTANKSKNTQKITPKSVPKDEGISGVASFGAPLVTQTAFGHQKFVPSAAQVPPMIEKATKKTPKSPPIAKTSSHIQVFWEPGPVDCANR
jgi:hypothetical protein